MYYRAKYKKRSDGGGGGDKKIRLNDRQYYR